MKTKAIEIHVVENDAVFRDMTVTEYDTVFNAVFPIIIQAVNALRLQPIQKPGEIKYTTFYDWVALLRN